MNRNIGMGGAACTGLAVLVFAGSMLAGAEPVSYFSSIFIALGFVVLMCAFWHRAAPERKSAGLAAAAFSCVYAALVLLVYFAQLTAVPGGLSGEAAQLLDFRRFGLFFNYDLLGYAMMALATFFAGLTVAPRDRADGWLRALLLIHGVFFVTCLLLPLTGLFARMAGADWVGTAVLEFWCLYFLPVAALSWRYFAKDV